MLGLPGSAYLYQGEELGLEEVDVPPEARQDPAWFRTGKPGPRRRPGADPVARHAPAVRLQPRPGTQPWLPMPDDWAALTVAAQRKDPDVDVVVLPRGAAGPAPVRADAGDDRRDGGGPRRRCCELRRGPLTVVCNCGSRPVRLPPGEVVVASGPLAGGLLPPDTASGWIR